MSESDATGGRARRKLAATGLLALGVAACASAPPGGDTDTPQALAFRSHCSICHALPAPKRHSFAEWELLLPVMEQRMAERGVAPLTPSDRTAILSYLKVNGR